MMGSLCAQNIPKLPVKPAAKPVSKPVAKPVQKTAVVTPAPTTQIVKFLSDADGELYIDGEKIGDLETDVPLRVKLEKGEYDWAHLAYSIWPDRVRKKCKKDLSMAIAHGLEDICEVKPKEKKEKKEPKPKKNFTQRKLIE